MRLRTSRFDVSAQCMILEGVDYTPRLLVMQGVNNVEPGHLAGRDKRCNPTED